MSIRNIFIYWIGKEYKLILILRNLIYLHSKNGFGYKVNLITDNNIKNYIKNIPDYFTKLCPAHQADFIRVNVICDYGGIWLDSDTIVLDSLDSLFNFIENQNGFFIKQNNDILCNGVFGSKPKTELMIKWKTEMINKLNITQGKIEWCDIGNNMLKNIYNINPKLYDDYNIFNGLENLYPVNWDNCECEFLNKPYDNYKTINREYQPLIVLVNPVYKNLEDKREQEILEGYMPLNFFINKSISNLKININNLYTNQKILNYGKFDYISSNIIDYKCWEPNISNIFNTIIKNYNDNNDNNNNNNIIIDIGCNIGYYSIISANHSNISKIYSIDGNSNNINMLYMSCKFNNINNIYPINKIISEKNDFYKEGNREIINKNGNIGGLTFIKDENICNIQIDNMSIDDIINTKNIKSITIDELISKNNLNNIIIMKIDIEGGELNALKGGIISLKSNKIKHIIIEISPKFNNDSIEILNILKFNDYEIYNIPHQEYGFYNNDDNFLNKIINNPIKDINQFIKTIEVQTNILAKKNIINS